MALLPSIRTRVRPLCQCDVAALIPHSPYYGQASWFLVYHPEKVPSAIERYSKEIVRVLGVLEGVLSKQEWLVGGKCTIADIAFIT